MCLKILLIPLVEYRSMNYINLDPDLIWLGGDADPEQTCHMVIFPDEPVVEGELQVAKRPKVALRQAADPFVFSPQVAGARTSRPCRRLILPSTPPQQYNTPGNTAGLPEGDPAIQNCLAYKEDEQEQLQLSKEDSKRPLSEKLRSLLLTSRMEQNLTSSSQRWYTAETSPINTEPGLDIGVDVGERGEKNPADGCEWGCSEEQPGLSMPQSVDVYDLSPLFENGRHCKTSPEKFLKAAGKSFSVSGSLTVAFIGVQYIAVTKSSPLGCLVPKSVKKFVFVRNVQFSHIVGYAGSRKDKMAGKQMRYQLFYKRTN